MDKRQPQENGSGLIKEPFRKTYREAVEKCVYWVRQYEAGRNVNDLLAAGQQWGIACGLAIAAEIEGRTELKEEVLRDSPPLFPAEFDDLPF